MMAAGRSGVWGVDILEVVWGVAWALLVGTCRLLLLSALEDIDQ